MSQCLFSFDLIPGSSIYRNQKKINYSKLSTISTTYTSVHCLSTIYIIVADKKSSTITSLHLPLFSVFTTNNRKIFLLTGYIINIILHRIRCLRESTNLFPFVSCWRNKSLYGTKLLFHHIETLIFNVQNKSFSCNKLFIRSLSSTHRCLPRNKRKFYFHSITKNNDVYKYQSSGEYWHFFSEKQIKSYKISL